jgi:DNA-binding MurR/RpiR family transcriptional regulator
MILEQIRQFYPQLTKSQRRLADFIATSYQEAAFMTASRLANRLNINEATVIRFAQRLGYPGFPELILDVRNIVQEELKAGTEPPQASGAGTAFMQMLGNEVEALQRAASHITSDLALEALQILREAQRIYVLGHGLSLPLAQLLSLQLRLLGIRAENLPSDVLHLAVILEESDEHCAVVALLAASESPEMANTLRLAGQKGARTLALTSSPISACAQAAELSISYAPAESSSVPSVAVLAALLDALVQTCAADRPDDARLRMAHYDETRDLLLVRRYR